MQLQFELIPSLCPAQTMLLWLDVEAIHMVAHSHKEGHPTSIITYCFGTDDGGGAVVTQGVRPVSFTQCRHYIVKGHVGGLVAKAKKEALHCFCAPGETISQDVRNQSVDGPQGTCSIVWQPQENGGAKPDTTAQEDPPTKESPFAQQPLLASETPLDAESEAEPLDSFLRPLVQEFASFMEEQLRANETKRQWETASPQWLLYQALERVKTVQLIEVETRGHARFNSHAHLESVEWQMSKDAMCRKCVHAANFLMMAASILRQEVEGGTKQELAPVLCPSSPDQDTLARQQF